MTSESAVFPKDQPDAVSSANVNADESGRNASLLDESSAGQGQSRRTHDAPLWMDIKSRHLFTIFVLAVLAFILYLSRDALGPYILAIVFAYILLPIVRRFNGWLSAAGLSPTLSRVTATLTALTLILAGGAILIYYMTDPIVEEVSQLADDFPTYWEDLTDSGSVGAWYEESVPEDIQAYLDENVGQLGKSLLGGMTEVLDYLFSISGSIISAILAMVIIPIFAVYFLIDRPNAEAGVQKLMPKRWADDVTEVLGFTDSIMSSYTRGVIITSLIVGVITGLGYAAIGVEIWVSLGVIAFVGEIVPILGPWIAFFISFPIILVTQPEKAIPAAVVFGVVQALEGWLISPKIQGDSIELPASLVLIALSIGGAVAGPIGIVIALPVAAIGRAIVVYTMNRLDGLSPQAASKALLVEPSEMADGLPLSDPSG